MAVYREQLIANDAVVLDGHEFVACEFRDCRMIYKGGEMPRLAQCHFVRCTWQLDEAAQRTVLFLRGVYHSGAGGRELVEQTLKHIRVR